MSEHKHGSIDKLGIVAGGGRLPLLLTESCHAEGRPYHVLLLDGFAEEKDYKSYTYGWTHLGALGKTAETLKDKGCTQVVMAGHVRRPDLKKLKLDWRATKLLPQLLGAARRGDDALLSVVVKSLEEDGLKVVGADDVLAHLLISEGPQGRHHPSESDLADIERAKSVVTDIGALDIGQGAVICNQLVLAVEAVEGTDEMLKRCAAISTDLRGTAEARRGVLLKMPKPGQERRVDLPTIGVQTIQRAADAGLAGVAVAAGGALVLDQQHVIELADELGLFVVGISADPQPVPA